MYTQIRNVASQFISDFTKEELDLIEKHFYPKKLGKNEHLLQVGEVAKEVFFIYKGIMRNYVPISKKGHITNYFAEEGMFNTSAVSFFTQQPSYEAVQAIEPCEGLAIQFENLEALYDQYHNWERLGRLFLQAILIKQDLRLRWFIEKSAIERYEAFLKTYPHLMQRIPQYYGASYLGITPESLSRLRSRNQKVSTDKV